MGREELLLMQLFGGGAGWIQTGGWMQVVYLVFLLLVPLKWPERIRVVAAFRLAWLLFACSVFLPSIASIVISNLVPSSGGFRSSGENLWFMQLANAIGPCCFGASLILAMKAVVPRFVPPQDSRPVPKSDL